MLKDAKGVTSLFSLNAMLPHCNASQGALLAVGLGWRYPEAAEGVPR